MSSTRGQVLAIDQVRAIAAASGGGVQLTSIINPSDADARLWIEISVDCSDIEQHSNGIHLRGRERFQIAVGADFPYQQPSVYTTRPRWAGTPHVHWGRLLCLYQAASEWDAQAGVYGLARRLHLWLSRAAAGELDPDDAPLHPPVLYGRTGTPIIVDANTPPVQGVPWIGFADLDVRSDDRIDISGWREDWPSNPAALALLLPDPFGWEYPTRVDLLLDAVVQQGIDSNALDALLLVASQSRDAGEPMHVVVGTPMRRGLDGKPRHHVAVWEIEAKMADGLRAAWPRANDDSEIAGIRAELRAAVFEWAKVSTIRWCPVSDNRPEIVIRRDDQSPVAKAFGGKKVTIWGCGALGANIADWVTRAGAAKVVLYDDDRVSPGVLVRQPYGDDDVGRSKAHVLATHLREIRRHGFEVDSFHQNVLTGPLSREDWADQADILIDATASQMVRLKLEAVRKQHQAERTTIASLLFGHRAERGLAVVSPGTHSGGTEDVLRQVKIACCSREGLKGFADEFWPGERRTDHFQPEPGCSDTTFRGSAVEVAALASALLHSVSRDIASEATSASAHLHALPAAYHDGQRIASLSFPSAQLMEDGVGDYELRLSRAALADIRGWIARNDRAGDPKSETGGVIFGRRDEATRIVWIDSLTGPPPDSFASPVQFVCGTDGVREATNERKARTRGEVEYLGMWHTHPRMKARASLTDVSGMLGLVAAQDAREAVMLIVGGRLGAEELSGYVFNGDRLRAGPSRIEIVIDSKPTAVAVKRPEDEPSRDIGLALSGGGSRALAFHLGCLRALHDRGVLPRVRVVSGVSGGALMAALYSYGHGSFEEFDARVVELLRVGLHRRVARRAVLSRRLPQDVATRVIAGSLAAAGAAASRSGIPRANDLQMRRWVSRTDAFEDVLMQVVGEGALDQPRRNEGLDVVINACDLRTGTAFRFGSRESSSSRLGRLSEAPAVATAVAASAAYPVLLPALDRTWEFVRRDGTKSRERVVLTDGGVYDNSGTSCLKPGRDPAYTYNIFPVDYIIACDAGRGRLAEKLPFHAIPRINRAFEASFRKLQDASRAYLHAAVENGELKGFVMPYLGQIDGRLPWAPPDLVRRSEVADYPTDFAAMDTESVEALTARGELLSRLLIERWCPDI